MNRSRRILLLVLLTGLFFAILWNVSQYFAVSKIELHGVEYLKGLETVNHSFLPFVRIAVMTQELSLLNPTLASLSVRKEYPHTLIITARKQRPAVELQLADGSVTLSESGRILKKSKIRDDDSELPQIVYYQPLYYNQLTVGESIDNKEVYVAASFAQRVLELGAPVSTIDITNENMIVLHADTYKVIVTSEVDVEIQSARLNYTFTELQRKKKKFSSIDVRFERPIITLQK